VNREISNSGAELVVAYMSNGKLCRVPSWMSEYDGRLTDHRQPLPRTYCGDRCYHTTDKNVCRSYSQHTLLLAFVSVWNDET